MESSAELIFVKDQIHIQIEQELWHQAKNSNWDSTHFKFMQLRENK